METHLQSLIDKIKEEGVEEGEKQSARIVTLAEEKAAKIIEDAEIEASQILQKAKAEAAKAQEAGKQAVQLAARDLILSVRQQLVMIIEKILRHDTDKSLTIDLVGEMLMRLVDQWDWRKAERGELEVLLPEQELNRVQEYLLQRTRDEFKQGVHLKVSPHFESGFRIGMKDGDVHYDFTDSGIAGILSNYLNPTLAELIKQMSFN